MFSKFIICIRRRTLTRRGQHTFTSIRLINRVKAHHANVSLLTQDLSSSTMVLLRILVRQRNRVLLTHRQGHQVRVKSRVSRQRSQASTRALRARRFHSFKDIRGHDHLLQEIFTTSVRFRVLRRRSLHIRLLQGARPITNITRRILQHGDHTMALLTSGRPFRGRPISNLPGHVTKCIRFFKRFRLVKRRLTFFVLLLLGRYTRRLLHLLVRQLNEIQIRSGFRYTVCCHGAGVQRLFSCA